MFFAVIGYFELLIFAVPYSPAPWTSRPPASGRDLHDPVIRAAYTRPGSIALRWSSGSACSRSGTTANGYVNRVAPVAMVVIKVFVGAAPVERMPGVLWSNHNLDIA